MILSVSEVERGSEKEGADFPFLCDKRDSFASVAVHGGTDVEHGGASPGFRQQTQVVA